LIKIGQNVEKSGIAIFLLEYRSDAMATDTQDRGAAQAGFVDLYELLKLPTDADQQALRKRINEYYLEAQQNLDHRNAKKRLHFQQMFEVYLPQARHLLLDPSRRAEYDRYVVAFRTGSNVVPLTAEERAQVAATANTTEVLPEMTAQGEAESAVTAAKREELWNKWKLDLEKALHDEEERAAADRARREAEKQAHRYADPNATAEQQGVQTAAGGYPIGGGAVVGGKAKSFENSPHGVYGNQGEVKVRRSWSVDKAPEQQKAQETAVADKERERQKRAMLEKKADAQAQTWGVGAAVGTFVLTYLIGAYLFFPAIEDAPVIEKLFDIIPTAIVALVVAGIAAWKARDIAGDLGRKQILAALPPLDEPGKKSVVGGLADRPVLKDYSSDPKAQMAGRMWGAGAGAGFLVVGYLALSVVLFPILSKKGPDIEMSGAGQSPFKGQAAAIPGVIEAENFDQGPAGVAFFDTDNKNEGGHYRNWGVDIAPAGENNFKVGWNSEGEWYEYAINVASSGYYNMIARIDCGGEPGQFTFYCDGKDITGPITGVNTGEWGKFTEKTISGIYLPAGQHTLRLQMGKPSEKDKFISDFDKFTFEPAGYMSSLSGLQKLMLLALLGLTGAVAFFAAQTGRQKTAEALSAEAAKNQKTA
jgi:hypothetical protein